MKKLLFLLLIICSCSFNYGLAFQKDTSVKNIILMAGAKSHGPEAHEYIKSVRLIKAMLLNSGINNLNIKVILNDWPEDETVLEDADLLLTISDGEDGRNAHFQPVPFTVGSRMETVKRLKSKGCGFMSIHFSTFIPDKFGDEVLEMMGGYFDFQEGTENNTWYSAIKRIQTEIKEEDLASHPINNGVNPFPLREEFYYNIRFRKNDERLVPILKIPDLGSEKENGNVVAWAVERKDGGRGFSTTMGHYYDNWQNPDFRKMILNAIVWTAGIEVPESGIESEFYSDDEVTEALYGKKYKGFIITGNHHPAHKWRETSPLLQSILENGTDIKIDISLSVEDLVYYNLKDYDFLLLNYCNWKDSPGISERAKNSLTTYLKNGGGLIIYHFSNGAFHYSLPEAQDSDWPEYRKIVPRVWNHGESGHDSYGKFIVKIEKEDHFITKGLSDFETADELYFKQAGDILINPLLVAKSSVTGKDEPLAWTHDYYGARVFQLLLGHSTESLKVEEIRTVLQRAAIWTIKK